MPIPFRNSLVLFLVAAGAVACTSSEDRENAKKSTSSNQPATDIDGAQELSSLDKDGKKSLCAALSKPRKALEKANKAAACVVKGIEAAGPDYEDAKACERAIEDCESEEVDGESCTDFAKIDLDDCSGNVDEYVACVNDMADGAKGFDLPSCKDLDGTSLIALSRPLPSSCLSFFGKCDALQPRAIEGGEGSSGAAPAPKPGDGAGDPKLETNDEGCVTTKAAQQFCGFQADGAICDFAATCPNGDVSTCAINCEMMASSVCVTPKMAACVVKAVEEKSCDALVACRWVLTTP